MTQSRRLDAAARQKEVMQTHCPPVIIHMSLPHICHSAQVWNKLISSSRPDDKALNRHTVFNEGTNQVMNHWKPSVSTCCRFAPSDVDAVPWSFCFRLSRTWSHWIEAAGKAGQHPTGVLCSIECECQCQCVHEALRCRGYGRCFRHIRTSWGPSCYWKSGASRSFSDNFCNISFCSAGLKLFKTSQKHHFHINTDVPVWHYWD